MSNEDTHTSGSVAHTVAGLDGKPVLVHKKGCEGALVIGSLSGRIIQPIMERPDWAEGLSVALLAERHEFYMSRLGIAPGESPMLEFEDLGWVGVNAEGEAIELTADSEFRMDVLAETLGVIRTDDLSDTREDDTSGELGHVLLDETREYAHGEATTLAHEDVTSAEHKTGTEG
jgi:hypothetical protein